MEPTAFVEERYTATSPSKKHVIVLDVGEDATIATVYLSMEDRSPPAPGGEAAWITAELTRALDPDVMDGMVANGLIEFEVKVPMAPPESQIFYQPHDLAFALMRATSSRGCVALVSRSDWKAGQTT